MRVRYAEARGTGGLVAVRRHDGRQRRRACRWWGRSGGGGGRRMWAQATGSPRLGRDTDDNGDKCSGSCNAMHKRNRRARPLPNGICHTIGLQIFCLHYAKETTATCITVPTHTRVHVLSTAASSARSPGRSDAAPSTSSSSRCRPPPHPPPSTPHRRARRLSPHAPAARPRPHRL